METQKHRKTTQFAQKEIEDIPYFEVKNAPVKVGKNEFSKPSVLERINNNLPKVQFSILSGYLWVLVCICIRLAFALLVGLILGLIWAISSVLALFEKPYTPKSEFESPKSVGGTSVEVDVKVRVNP